MFTKKTIRDIDVRGKRVLLRTDYNVPLDAKGSITDDYRIKKSLPTIQFLLDQDAKLIICSHLGRPAGPEDKKFSLFPVAKRLNELLKKDVEFVPDCIGERAEKIANGLQAGQVALLENLRFHSEEEKDDEAFASKIASLAEIFVQDGFGVVHRAHASTVAVTHFLPSVAGLLVENEVDTITDVMIKPNRPLVAVVGGSKIADKIDILYRFIDIADFVAIGGAMANTFLLAEGISVGASLADRNDLQIAKDILAKTHDKAKNGRFVFYLPQDGVVASKIDKTAPTRIVDWSAHVVADIESYPKRPPHLASYVREHEMILDIGPFSASFIAGSMQFADTVVWNGTMGVTEMIGLQGPVGPYSHGTDLIMESMMGLYGHRPYTLIGGGDTAGYVEQRKLIESFDHVSTGGGASLELMAGRKLPGVEALMDK